MAYVHDARPGWAQRGFAKLIYWSITCEIDKQIAQLRQRGLAPALIRLGPAASVVYAHEHWAQRIEDAPACHRGYRCDVPIVYRDERVSGVAIEGR